MRTRLKEAKRIVVKVGSALVTNNGAGLDLDFVCACARQIAALAREGRQLTLVSSGAIAAGMQQLGWTTRPHEMHRLQAAAAVGQMGLCHIYESAFAEQGLKTAQILLTHDDLADRTRYLNARSTLNELLSLGVVPIINENDTVVTDEIKFGDNDTLGALVANLIEADTLAIMTDQKGLYTADPRRDPAATLITEGSANDSRFESMAGGAASSLSKGGMITKVRAARRAARSGADTLILSGHGQSPLTQAFAGEAIGTFLTSGITPLAARKQWLADHLQTGGSLTIDAGAERALRSGRSLLPVGVTAAKGEFARGAVVSCLTAEGSEIARGLINYSMSESLRILQRSSNEIEAILGYVDAPELIHRNNLVLLG
jgi:glutamate 5-kinase